MRPVDAYWSEDTMLGYVFGAQPPIAVPPLSERAGADLRESWLNAIADHPLEYLDVPSRPAAAAARSPARRSRCITPSSIPILSATRSSGRQPGGQGLHRSVREPGERWRLDLLAVGLPAAGAGRRRAARALVARVGAGHGRRPWPGRAGLPGRVVLQHPGRAVALQLPGRRRAGLLGAAVLLRLAAGAILLGGRPQQRPGAALLGVQPEAGCQHEQRSPPAAPSASRGTTPSRLPRK